MLHNHGEGTITQGLFDFFFFLIDAIEKKEHMAGTASDWAMGYRLARAGSPLSRVKPAVDGGHIL